MPLNTNLKQTDTGTGKKKGKSLKDLGWGDVGTLSTTYENKTKPTTTQAVGSGLSQNDYQRVNTEMVNNRIASLDKEIQTAYKQLNTLQNAGRNATLYNVGEQFIQTNNKAVTQKQQEIEHLKTERANLQGIQQKAVEARQTAQMYTDYMYRQKYANYGPAALLSIADRIYKTAGANEEYNWIQNYLQSEDYLKTLSAAQIKNLQTAAEKRAADKRTEAAGIYSRASENAAEKNAWMAEYGVDPSQVIDTNAYVELLKNAAAERKEETTAERYKRRAFEKEQADKYDDLTKKENFNKYSGYNSKITDTRYQMVMRPNKFLTGSTGSVYYSEGKIGSTGGEMDPERLMHMRSSDRARFSYIWQTEGADAAMKFLYDYAQYKTGERAKLAEQLTAENLANDAPVLASIVSVPENLMSGMGALDVAAQNISNKFGEYRPVNYNTSAMNANTFTQTVRGTVARNIADSTGTIHIDADKNPFWARLIDGKSLADVYQLGMSMLDSAAIAAMSPMIGEWGTIFLGGSAATQGILEALSKGATDTQALYMGILNGTFEALFEKVSLDQLLEGKNISSFILRWLSQAGVEASEETFTTLANWMADAIVMAEKSDNAQAVQNYVAQGYTEEQAKKKAMRDSAVDLAWDAIGGFVSGGMMATGYSAINKAAAMFYESRGTTGLGKAIRSDAEIMSNIAQYGLSLEQGTSDYETAAKLRDNVPVTNDELGSLFANYMYKYTEQRDGLTKNAVQNRLAELGETDIETQTDDIMKALRTGKATELSDVAQQVYDELRRGNSINDTEWVQALKEQIGELETRFTSDDNLRIKQQQEIQKALEQAKLRPQTPVQQRYAMSEMERSIAQAKNPQLPERTNINALPTAEEADRNRRWAKAKTDTARSGILAGADDTVIKQAERLSKWFGTDVRFFKGPVARDGFHDSGTIYINANGKNPLASIVTHELTHRLENTKVYQAFQDTVLNLLTEGNKATLDKLIQDKIDTYAKYGETIDETGAKRELTAEFVQKHMLSDMKSIRKFVRANRQGAINFRGHIGDMLAKMTGAEAQEKSLLEKAYDLYGQALAEIKENNNENRQWEINEQFKYDIREWNKNGRGNNEIFILGSTGNVLQGLGSIENDIFFTSEKALEILKDHKEMTPADFEVLPDIIDDPILVLKSKGNNKNGLNARMVLISDKTAQNGRPILTVLDLKPKENNIAIDDMHKINSAYTRRDAKNLIKSSEVMHADKNRTIPLLRKFGLTIASRQLLHHGSIGSITYEGNIVKLQGEKYDTFVNKNSVVTATDNNSASETQEKRSPSSNNVKRQFSLSEPVEQTKDLIALHNLSEDKLLKSIALGGFPMPSIAVTKSSIPHTNFGDITLVMDKNTVDPQADRRNTVYSADAWTPTFPQIEYEVDDTVASKLRHKYYDMAKQYGYDFMRPLYDAGVVPEDLLNRNGGEQGVIDKYRNDTDVQNIYLADTTGEPVEDIQKQNVKRMTDEKIAEHEFFIDMLGEDVIRDLSPHDGEGLGYARKRWATEHMDELDAAIAEYYRGYGLSDQEIANVMDNVSSMTKMRDYVVGAHNYLLNGPETVTTENDTEAKRQAIKDRVDQQEYEAWLRDLFTGIEKSSGIYNNRDYYTPSGDRRSFAATHYAATLENIAKAMAGQNNGNTKNVSGFYGIKTLRAATALKFSSTDEMHDYEWRLQHLTEEEAEQISDELSERMIRIMQDIYDTEKHSEYENQFIEIDRIGRMLADAAELRNKSTDNIRKVFKDWQYGNVSTETIEQVRELLDAVSAMPVNIFEAKPERAVTFDEVMAAVIPDNVSDELRTKLRDMGVNTIEYEAGNDDARLKAVNSVEGAQWSITPEQDAEYLEIAKDPEGNKAKLDRMVEQAAMQMLFNSKAKDNAGNLLKVYHGTTAYDRFNVFKRGKSGYLGPGMYFTENESYANRYATAMGDDGQLYGVYLDIQNPIVCETDDPAKEILRTLYGSDNIYNKRSAKQGNLVYLITQADIKKAKAKGYDGVVWTVGVREFSVWDSSQIKSADPVTYDDDGNVIPLTERFNTENEDIRWSLTPEEKQSKLEELRQYLRGEKAKRDLSWEQDDKMRMPNLMTYADNQAQKIIKTAHGQGLSVDEYLRQNTELYEKDGLYNEDARNALQMEQRQYSISEVDPLMQEKMDLLKQLDSAINAKDYDAIINRIRETGIDVIPEIETIVAQKMTKPIAESKPTTSKMDLKKDLYEIFSIPSGYRKSIANIIDNYADTIIKQGSINDKDVEDFTSFLYSAGVVKAAEVPELTQIAKEVMGSSKKLYVPVGVKHEFGDDWNAWRKRAFAAGIILTNNTSDLPIDTAWQELGTSMPGIFAEDEYDATIMLQKMIEIAEQGRVKDMPLSEYTRRDAKREGYSEEQVLQEMEDKARHALLTFAEKAKLEIKLKDRTGIKIAQERENARAQIANLRKAEIVRRAREQTERAVQRRRQAENRALKELQQKTLKQLQWLNRNRNKAPADLKETWDDVLGDIDIYAVSAANELNFSNKYQKTWRDLRDMYVHARDYDPNFLPSAEMEKIVARLDGDHIADMDIDALNDLYRAAIGIRTEFYNRNNVLNDDQHRLFADVYANVKEEFKNADTGYKTGKVAGAVDTYFNDMQLTPMNYLERMAGWNPDSDWYSMAKQLEAGERAARRFDTESHAMLNDWIEEHKDWIKRADGQGTDAIWYEITVPELLELGMGDKPIFGNTVTVYMTPMQKVHMYLESKNFDNLRHMVGGRTFADKELYSKGKRTEAFAQGKTIRLAPETVKGLVSNLTAEEKALADILEKYYNEYSSGKINEVSNVLYGYDKSIGKNYAPIFTNKNYTKSDPGIFDITAEGVGNMKGRVTSYNPSYNLSALDAFDRSVRQTAKFVGLAIPIRNMNTLMNWRESNNSMADVITHKHGEGAKKFVNDLLTELQSGKEVKHEKIEEFVNKALAKYIGATFGLNPSIVLKQFASYPLAAAYLGWSNMPLNVIESGHGADVSFISKYTGELDYRLKGYATPETATLTDNPSKLEENKVYKFAFGGGSITWMDSFTVRTLWAWAENKVAKDNPDLEKGTKKQMQNGESPFYKQVAKEFEEAVSRSQPMYDIMHRSTIMRSNSSITRAFTLFKTVPQQEYNMLRQTLGEAKYYANSKTATAEQKRAARQKAGNAITGIMLGNLMIGTITFLNALLKNGAKAYRDKDKELTLESFMLQAGKQYFRDSVGIAAGADQAADILNAMIFKDRWYGIETPGITQIESIIEEMINAGVNAKGLVEDSIKVLNNGGDWQQYMKDNSGKYLASVEKMVRLLATYGGGFAAENLRSYLLGVMSYVAPDLKAGYEDLFDTPVKSDLAGMSGAALEKRVGHIMAYRANGIDSDTAAAIAELYEAGYTGAMPADIQKSYSVGGEDRELDIVKRQKYQNAWSDAVSGVIDTLTASDDFKNADAETRTKMLKKLYDYGAEKAKAAVFDDYEISSTATKYDALIADGVTLAEIAAAGAVLTGTVTEKSTALKDLSFDDDAKIALYNAFVSDAHADVIEEIKGTGLAFNEFLDISVKITDIKNDKLQTGYVKTNAVRDLIRESGYTGEQKAALYREYVSSSESNQTKIDTLEKAGLDIDEFLKIQNEFARIDDTYSGSGEKATEFSRWLNSTNYTAAQKSTIKDTFKYYSQIPASAKRYDDLMAAGLSDDKAYAVNNALDALKPLPGADEVSNVQKWEAVTKQNLSAQEQITVLQSLMGDSDARKVKIAYDYGIEPQYYVQLKKILPDYDADGNGSYTQAEITNAINSMTFSSAGGGLVLPTANTNSMRAALWQLQTGSTSAKNNPYSTAIGAEVAAAVKTAKENEKSQVSNAAVTSGNSTSGGVSDADQRILALIGGNTQSVSTSQVSGGAISSSTSSELSDADQRILALIGG